MRRKALQVQVELDIQAVTCPGVYLCPNGKISLQLYMLDSGIQTGNFDPIFPILCHEKFIFYKTFFEAQRLSELQKLLSKEYLYMELIQWQNCELGNVLASFQTNLNELLYPSTREGSMPGVDIDLLMVPARNFPGLIAPKVEVSTKTIIEDTVCDTKRFSSFVVNPKTISSKSQQIRSNPIRQRKVCHSTGYHRSRKCFPRVRKIGRPPFTYRKVDDNLLARKPQGLGTKVKEECKCRLVNVVGSPSMDSDRYGKKSAECSNKIPTLKTDCWSKVKSLREAAKTCLCTNTHEYEKCPVCSKYRYYFEVESNSMSQKGDAVPRKQCLLQKPGQHRRCTCEEIVNTSDAKVIRYTSPKETTEGTNEAICFCPPQLKLSLAERLHQRLNQTLDSCIDCACDIYEVESRSPSPVLSQSGTILECECPDVSVGDVYKNLYRKAKSRISKYDKYVTPCCT